MAAQTIDKELFKKRIKRVYTAWKNGEESLSKVDFIVVTMGVDEVAYSKSTALQIWLLGVEMTDTLIVLCENGVYVLASKKKLDYMKGIDSTKEADGVPPIKTLLRDKNDKDSANFATLVGAMKSSRKGRTMGEISKDKFTGDFMKQWQDTIGEQFEKVDVNGALAIVLAVKDEQEIGLIRKATQATMDLYNKFLKEQIIEIIDENKKVKHSKLATQTEEAMKNKKYVSGVSESDIDICYPVIIQSGGTYALKYSVESDTKDMHFGCIVCMMGLKYRSYCSNVARTILVNPTEEMQQTYDLLLDVQDAVLAKLHAGERLSDVFEAGVAVVRAKKPQLVDKLTNSFGFATGLEFREGHVLIAGKTMATVQKGMVFNVSIGFSGLVNSAATENAGKNYALFVGDIVLTNDMEPATILTSLKKRVKHISIFLKDPNEEEEDEEEETENKKAATEAVNKNGEILGRGARKSAVLQARTRMETTGEEKRGHHQKDLANRINEAAKERLKGQKSGSSEKKDRRLAVSYKSILQLPKETEVLELKIFVDKKSETVIVPIYGAPVPFHISTIKNISQSVEGDYTYLRINFYHPGATLGRNEGPIFPNTDAQFLKEMTYRASNNKEPGELSAAALNLNTAFRLIKEVQKKFKTREAEEREMEDLVKQDTLVVNANRTNPKLKDLYIRPNIVSKRISGTLEAHQNGFRFTSVRGDKVDILYNNIKNAFFQPCDSEMIILLHFHLRHAILFGKKKHVDVQFYTEVGEITTDLGKHRHMHDRDDLYAEQAERDLRQKLKSAFWSFCEKVDQMTKGELEFDRPFRDLGFHGAPFRSTTLLQPTSLCLVSLTDWPPFVVNLSEVELVHFERVQFQLKNFDMVFVYKDYTRKVSMINSIPMNSLDHVKNWLDSCDIHYTEGIQSLNWVKIMKTINDDAEGFFDQGGWSFLHPESDEEREEEDDEDEEDDAYEPSGAESGEEASSDEESDDDDESDWEAEQSDSGGSDEDLGSDESEGKDWDELEEEARRADEEDDDSGNDQKKKSKKPSSHKSPAKKSSSSHRSSSHKSPQKSSKSASSSGRKRQNSGDNDRGAKRKKH